MVDTSVLVAGVAGFRDGPIRVPSAALLARWTQASTFVWLVNEEILTEYLEVLQRLRVRSAAAIVALIREEAHFVRITKRIPNLPDQDDAPFCECAESGGADFIVTLNPGDFPQTKLKARVIAPTDPLPAGVRKPRPRRKRLLIRKK